MAKGPHHYEVMNCPKCGQVYRRYFTREENPRQVCMPCLHREGNARRTFRYRLRNLQKKLNHVFYHGECMICYEKNTHDQYCPVAVLLDRLKTLEL